MNMIATSLNPMSQLVTIFHEASKQIRIDALGFIHGDTRKKAARAFLGLSKNSKMPAYTLAIPARQTCPRGDKLALIQGSVCHNCYAMKGHDAMAPAKLAKARRLAVIKLALSHPQVAKKWVKAFTIAMEGETHFRWHSAGDLFSLEYAQLVAKAIEATPWVSHWIPTREGRLAYVFQDLGNAVVRVSDDMVNQVSNKHQGSTSGVHTKGMGRGFACPAPLQGGSCGDCRQCWSATVGHVSYFLH